MTGITDACAGGNSSSAGSAIAQVPINAAGVLD